MTWANSVPNLLIGLREGLEAGLVVSILLATVRKTAPSGGEDSRVSTAPIWLGVLGAVMLAGSFAAVLTFSVADLSSRAQEAVGGLLSVLAVGLVTWMIFWMRRTAAGLAAHLRGEVRRAAAVGAGALTVTAFLAVGREGLETTLFLWTAARASGQTAAPLIGAAIGIAAAIALCWLLYRRAVLMNVGVFFNRTAIALIVIAAGVLAYGLGDLQDAGLLPGHAWVAFDLTARIDPGSWWASIITGITELSPKMTVLQVTAWLAYLAAVIPAFVKASPEAPAAPRETSGRRWEQLAGRRPWAVAGALVAVPALAAGSAIAALPAESAPAGTTVTVTKSDCAPEWTTGTTGTHTFTVTNNSGLAGEVNLDDAAGAVVGEIETIGPGTSAQLTATLGSGVYTFNCLMGSLAATASQAVQVTGAAADTNAPVAVKPVTAGDLTPANDRYQAYAAAQLADLARQVTAIRADLGRNDIAKAKQGWLPAQLDWERVGASYDSFGDLGLAVDGLPDGLANGVSDKAFTGLHRLEYGLWHGQSTAELEQVTATLAKNIAAVQRNLTTDELAGDPANLPVRAHEILEDALRDHLSGMDDEGGGAAFAQTYADVQVTRVVLGYLAPLLDARQPGLVATLTAQLDTLGGNCSRPRPTARGCRSARRHSPRVSTSTRPPERCLSRWPPFRISLKYHRPTDSGEGACTVVNPSRRNFLRGAISGAAGTALAGGAAIGGAKADADAATAAPGGDGQAAEPSYPFHGALQAGILTPGPAAKQAFTCVAAFDCVAGGRAGLTGLLRALTSRARFLTSGGTPPDLGVGRPPPDSDVLGPSVPADGLTATVSVGSSLFDDRYGLASRKPLKLTPMRVFPNDALEPAWLHGDLLVQLCANHPDTIHHAIRDITRHTRGGMALRWKIEGYNSPPRPAGASRNLLGFKDGTANPAGGTATSLVWVDDPAEPAWARGGSYQVVRLIRMLVEFWDRVSINEQENMFGRRRDSGAPLDGNAEFDAPDYEADPDGKVIPLDSHIRLANPRTPATANQRLIRRSYNYDLGLDANGNIQAGHVFIAYQQDIERQFETVQERLVNEPLVDYVQPFGGGYFFALPGVRDTTDWYGRGLLA